MSGTRHRFGPATSPFCGNPKRTICSNLSLGVTNTQLSLIQIDNYGPWTVTPEPRREMDLQTLQSRLFADLAQFVGNRDGYASSRGSTTDRRNERIRRGSTRTHSGTVGDVPRDESVSVATGTTPVSARERRGQLQAAGSAQDKGRREVLRGQTIDEEFRKPTDVQLAHFDVNDATEKYTDRLNEFDTFIQIEQGYAALMMYIREEYISLSFFAAATTSSQSVRTWMKRTTTTQSATSAKKSTWS